MSNRPYVSPARVAAAAEKRRVVVEAATRFLREESSITSFSLDAVAKAAGVTRLTVYHQFGSRRGLLEEVFDQIARDGRLDRIGDALAARDPWQALDNLVSIFCGFWAGDAALQRLHDAAAVDPEFAIAIRERNERRREPVRLIVQRIAGDAPAGDRRDAVDLIFFLTGNAAFRALAAGRPVKQVCAIVTAACRDAAQRLLRTR